MFVGFQVDSLREFPLAEMSEIDEEYDYVPSSSPRRVVTGTQNVQGEINSSGGKLQREQLPQS
jgi:hypothetical protein